MRIYVQLSPWRGWSTHNNHFRGFSCKTFDGFSGAEFERFSPGGCASGFRQHTEPRSEVQTTISREREKAFTAQKLWVYFESSFSSHCLHSEWRYMAPLNANELGWTNKFLATLQFIKIRGFLSKFLFRGFFLYLLWLEKGFVYGGAQGVRDTLTNWAKERENNYYSRTHTSNSFVREVPARFSAAQDCAVPGQLLGDFRLGSSGIFGADRRDTAAIGSGGTG